jgi:hypothetical protein
MRISAIVPVGRRVHSPVDAVGWHEQANRVHHAGRKESSPKGAFLKVLQTVQEESQRQRMRVVEVVYAPGMHNGTSPRRMTLTRR